MAPARRRGRVWCGPRRLNLRRDLLAPALVACAAAFFTGCAASGRSEALAPRFVVEPKAPQVVWTYQSGRGIEVTPLLSGGDIYLATTDRRIHKIEEKTGKRLWRKRIDAPLAGSPAVDGPMLYASTGRPDGSLYALDLATHHVRWKAPVGDASDGPIVFDQKIIFPTRDGKVFGLSPKDGRASWVADLEAKDWGTSDIDTLHALYFVPSRSGKLFGIDARSGARKWTAELHDPLVGVASGGGGVAAVSIEGDVSWVDASTGRVIWSIPARRRVSAPPVVAGDLVLVVGLDGLVSAFNIDNGSPAWQRSLGGPFRSAPAVARDRIALAAASGQVWLLDLPSGQILGTVRHPETIIVSPVASPSGWVVAGERGTVIAYRWKDPT